ncbi:MAG: hypothetical protein JO325_04010 [Solirubrobacterales bacterium]|nr:hypothetical protein [Solirubrobacterales bacterium]
MSRNVSALFGSPRTRITLRVLGAILLLFVGADHYYEYSVDDYSVLPTIGTLFLLNFISATAIGLLLLAPLDRILQRFARIALQLAALSGFGIAATSLVALLVSEHTKLFGFMESNYRPAIIVAITSEASAAVILLLVFTASWSANRPVRRPRAPLADHSSPSASTS